MVELVDTSDLKSGGPKGLSEFKSRWSYNVVMTLKVNEIVLTRWLLMGCKVLANWRLA